MAAADAAKVEATERTKRLFTVAVYCCGGVALLCFVVVAVNKVREPPALPKEFYEKSFEAIAKSQQIIDHVVAEGEPSEIRWTAKAIASHFSIPSLAQLRWSFPITSRDELVHALLSEAHVLQFPVAHAPPERPDTGAVVSWNSFDWEKGRDLTVQEVLEALVAAESKQGVMLLFQDPRVVRRALSPLQVYQQYSKMTGPVLIFAELVPGPGKIHPTMAKISVPQYVSESFKQAVPELQQDGFHPHPALNEKPSFVPFSANDFLDECQEMLPGAFLVAAWSHSAPCPKNYMPPHAKRRLLMKQSKEGKNHYVGAHMSSMENVIAKAKWRGGVAFSVEVCHIKTSAPHWLAMLNRREAAIPAGDTAKYAAAKPQDREPWLLFFNGMLAPSAGVMLRDRFRPQSVLLNVTDMEGRRVVV